MLTLLTWRRLRRRPARAVVTALGILAGVAGLRALDLGTTGAFASVRAAYESEAGPAELSAVPAGDASGALPREADDDVRGPDDVAWREEHGALDHVAQLPHVAGPVVRREALEGAG